MALVDLTRDELERYRPEREEPSDFDAFWRARVAEARAARADPLVSLEPRSTPVRSVAVRDVTFAGYAGEPVRGWYMRPAAVPADEPLPVLVEFLGYGRGRGRPEEHLWWAGTGYAHLVMDMRGQGFWRPGETPDGPYAPAGGQAVVITRGIQDPLTYYYTRLFTDAVRAVDTARALPGVDPGRLAVIGISQGGGTAIAAAGLAGVDALVADVPFLCHIRRAVDLTDSRPYSEVTDYLRTHPTGAETALRTLSYVDGVNHAARGRAPALFSVGLHDDICPPSTVYAAYHQYAGPKRMQVWPWADHASGGTEQRLVELAFLDEVLGRP